MNLGPVELAMLVALLGVMLLLLAARSARRSDPPARSLAEVSIPAELRSRVLALDAEGRRISAIKELRQATGLGLADAKTAVERIVAGGHFPVTPAARPDLADRVRRLVVDGRDDEAVRLVATETGLTAPEATAFVRSLRA